MYISAQFILSKVVLLHYQLNNPTLKLMNREKIILNIYGPYRMYPNDYSDVSADCK